MEWARWMRRRETAVPVPVRDQKKRRVSMRVLWNDCSVTPSRASGRFIPLFFFFFFSSGKYQTSFNASWLAGGVYMSLDTVFAGFLSFDTCVDQHTS